jgi:hypothetical protein
MPVKKNKRIKKKPIKRKRVVKERDIEMYKYNILSRDIDTLKQLSYIENALKNEQQAATKVPAIQEVITPMIDIITEEKVADKEKEKKKKKRAPIRSVVDPLDRIKGRYRESDMFKDTIDKEFSVINPKTNKPIHINKQVSKKLQAEGYKLGINSAGNYFYK